MPPVKHAARPQKTAGCPQKSTIRGGRRGAPRGEPAQHPGAVLAQILDDTPLPVAAKWFGIAPAELAAILAGEAPLTPALAAQAGAVFGTGSAPWLEMQAAWDEAHAPKPEAPESAEALKR